MALKSHTVTIEGTVTCRGGVLLSGFVIHGMVQVEQGSIVISDNFTNSIHVMYGSTPTIKSNHIRGGQYGIMIEAKSKVCVLCFILFNVIG
jgi:hypothetical protein